MFPFSPHNRGHFDSFEEQSPLLQTFSNSFKHLRDKFAYKNRPNININGNYKENQNFMNTNDESSFEDSDSSYNNNSPELVYTDDNDDDDLMPPSSEKMNLSITNLPEQETIQGCSHNPSIKHDHFSQSFDLNSPPIRSIGSDFRLFNEPKVLKTHSVYESEEITLCWIETTTIKEDKTLEPPARLVFREFTITFENSAAIPDQYLDCSRFNNEITRDNERGVCNSSFAEVIDEDTRRSKTVNLTTINQEGSIEITTIKKIKCGTGSLVTKDISKWLNGTENNRQRIEIKVSPSTFNIDEYCNSDDCVDNVTESSNNNEINKTTFPNINNEIKLDQSVNCSGSECLQDKLFGIIIKDDDSEPVILHTNVDSLTTEGPGKYQNLEAPRFSTERTSDEVISNAGPYNKILGNITTEFPSAEIQTTTESSIISSITSQILSDTATPDSINNNNNNNNVNINSELADDSNPSIKSIKNATITNYLYTPDETDQIDSAEDLKRDQFNHTIDSGSNPCSGSMECNADDSTADIEADSGSCDCSEESDSEESQLRRVTDDGNTTTTTAAILPEEHHTVILKNDSTTEEIRRSTLLPTTLDNPPGKKGPKRKLALQIHVYLEHINENEEKHKLAEVVKNLTLVDENSNEQASTSLLSQLQALNNSAINSLDAIKDILNCSILGNFSDVITSNNETKDRRSRREIEKNSKTNHEAIKACHRNIRSDVKAGLADLISQLSESKDKNVDVNHRRRRSVENDDFNDKLSGWSKVRFIRSIDGGELRSHTKLTILRNENI